jgi:hypothetical protein
MHTEPGSNSRKASARDVLNKLKWHEGYDIAKAEIYYLHRGAPGDTKVISGRELVRLDKSFFIIANLQGGETSIPYHRIRKIVYAEEVLWERRF